MCVSVQGQGFDAQQLRLLVGLADAFTLHSRRQQAATYLSVPGWRLNLAQVKGCHANLSMAGTCRNRSCEGVQVKSCSSSKHHGHSERQGNQDERS